MTWASLPASVKLWVQEEPWALCLWHGVLFSGSEDRQPSAQAGRWGWQDLLPCLLPPLPMPGQGHLTLVAGSPLSLGRSPAPELPAPVTFLSCTLQGPGLPLSDAILLSVPQNARPGLDPSSQGPQPLHSDAHPGGAEEIAVE